MPAPTSIPHRQGTSWGSPVPSVPWDLPRSPPPLVASAESVPWDLPDLTARGNGVIVLVDNGDDTRVNRLERLSLQIQVTGANQSTETAPDIVTIPFPARRQEAGQWRNSRPFEVDLFQLQIEHEEAFCDLHCALAFFAARHCPIDEECIQRQWHQFARAVWSIIADAEVSPDTRVLQLARWIRDELTEEVFEEPWWAGRWDWSPSAHGDWPMVRADEGSGSEFEFGEGLDGLPVPPGTFEPSPWSSWAQDAA